MYRMGVSVPINSCQQSFSLNMAIIAEIIELWVYERLPADDTTHVIHWTSRLQLLIIGNYVSTDNFLWTQWSLRRSWNYVSTNGAWEQPRAYETSNVREPIINHMK